jgi:hypothetical protein
MRTMDAPTIFTFKQTLGILSLSSTNLYRLVKTNKVPYRRIGGKILFTLEDINQILRDAKPSG